MTVNVRLRNAGVTAAEGFAFAIKLDTVALGTEPQFLYPDENNYAKGGVIIPGQVVNVPITIYQTLAQPFVDKVKRGEVSIYSHGRVIYHDRKRSYWMKFCYRYDPSASSAANWGACTENNSVGEGATSF